MNTRRLDFDGLDGVLELPPGTHPRIAPPAAQQNMDESPTVLAPLELGSETAFLPRRRARVRLLVLGAGVGVTAAVGGLLLLGTAPSPTDAAGRTGKAASVPVAVLAPLSAPEVAPDTVPVPVDTTVAAVPGATSRGSMGPSASEATYVFPARFALNDSRPQGIRREEVSALVASLGGCEGVVRVTGHSCSLGSEEAQAVIGLARAKAVVSILSRAGLPSNRLFAQTAGSREPLASNSTLAGRIRNRRVVLACDNEIPPALGSALAPTRR